MDCEHFAAGWLIGLLFYAVRFSKFLRELVSFCVPDGGGSHIKPWRNGICGGGDVACLLIQIFSFPCSIGGGRRRRRGRRMCPLRVILIFLSASLAGFFMLKGLRSQGYDEPAEVTGGENSLSLSGKVRSAMSLGFWTCVDMASGRYLWRNLVSSPPPSADSGKKI